MNQTEADKSVLNQTPAIIHTLNPSYSSHSILSHPPLKPHATISLSFQLNSFEVVRYMNTRKAIMNVYFDGILVAKITCQRDISRDAKGKGKYANDVYDF